MGSLKVATIWLAFSCPPSTLASEPFFEAAPTPAVGVKANLSIDALPPTDTAPVDSIVTPNSRSRLNQQRAGLDPRNDGWESEALAADAESILLQLLTKVAPATANENAVSDQVTADFACASLRPTGLRETVREGTLIVHRAHPETLRKASADHRGAAGLVKALESLVAPFGSSTRRAHSVKVVSIAAQDDFVASSVLIELYGRQRDEVRQIHATWECLWTNSPNRGLRLSAIRIGDYEEVITQGGQGVWFADCTASVLGSNPSYSQQLQLGLDHWLKRVERAHRIHVFAANGLAIGDANGDGLEDLYVCQPGGLPNRLFIQTPDGTAVDHSGLAGVDWLDSSSSALLLDLDNDNDQDLVVATLTGLIVMQNNGSGRFQPQTILSTGGADTQSLSATDYDNDGDLDLYICLSFPKVAEHPPELGDAKKPVEFVYHDANDGAANRLFRNDIESGDNWNFVDVTQSVGLDVGNRRHSLAAAWEDYDNDGDADLYVANDYGRNCLYRNDEGSFVEVAESAGVVDFGSGMSVSWADYNRDGWMDLYVGNMFSSAGNRIADKPNFRPGIDNPTRQILRRFAKGNSLFENTGNGRFREVGSRAAVAMGRWAWSSVFADLNNSGWEDLIVANGYITTSDTGDL